MGIFRKQQVQPRLAEIGRIFKGGPKRDRKRGNDTYQIFGEDLDHFRFEPNPRTKDLPSPDGQGTLYQYLSQRWADLGESPRTITIQFLSATPEDVFSPLNEVWASGSTNRCIRRCDGETQLLRLVEKGGKKALSKEPAPCAANDDGECPHKCKPVARLGFMLPALNYPGLIVLTTHSLYDINEILANLEMYRSFDLSKMRFQLCRTERTVSYEDKGELKNVQKWLCHLEIDPMFGNRIFAAQPKQYLAQIEQSIEAEVLEVYEDPDPPLQILPADYISREQQVRLFTIATKEKVDKTAISIYLESEWGIDSSSKILKADYEEICEAILKLPKKEPAPSLD